MTIDLATGELKELNIAMQPKATPFDPWAYDINNDGIIDADEAAIALDDYYAGIITYKQMEQVHTLYMETCKEYPPIEIFCVDSNNDGILDDIDKAAFLDAYDSKEGDENYRRQFDLNYNGFVDGVDLYKCLQMLGKDLALIRHSVKTGEHQELVWPSGWNAFIAALDKDKVAEFTGSRSFGDGWITVRHHPYWPDQYICKQFTLDTMLASYKGLGYGCLLPAASAGMHAFMVFWGGGDWQDLYNWWIIEPQDGTLVGCAGSDDLPSIYRPEVIRFPKYLVPSHELPHIMMHHLSTNYYRGKIIEIKPMEFDSVAIGAEEPIPRVFNRALGVE